MTPPRSTVSMMLGAVLGAAVVVSASGTGVAQDLATEEARGAFTAGQAAYRAGRFAEALDYFERAHELTGEPQLLYNVALMHDRLRHDQQALDMYRRYLAESPQIEERQNVEARIAILEDALGQTEAVTEDQATDAADGAEQSTGGDPGGGAETGNAPGGSGYRLDAPGIGTWIAAGLALASFGAAIGAWVHATNTYDGLRDSCGAVGCSDQEIGDSGIAVAVDLANGFLVAGSVLGAVAVTLFFTEPLFAVGGETESVSLHVGPASLMLRGTW